MDILEISEYQLYKLKSIDPNLSPDWREVIQHILPELDKESQNSVHKNILEPRGIYIGHNDELLYKRPATLKVTMKDIRTNNEDLISIASDMSKITDSRFEYYDAIQLADEIEAIFGHLDNLDIRNLLYEHKNRKRIRIAFLYDLAHWIDTVDLKVNLGLRRLDAHMVKSYLKEVFIKQKIQGQDFRKWDSSDVDFQEFTYLPSFIRNEGNHRKFTVVEGQEYWFIIGSAHQTGKNPYSFRRFLHEDSSGTDVKKYIYLTHVMIKKDDMHDSKYLSHVSYNMSRFYTLDRGVSDTLQGFVRDIQKLQKRYLKPLLKKRLEQDGGSTEAIIKERMITYEKQVSVLVLQKLPRIIESTLRNTNDQDYLFYSLDQLTKQMIENIQDFRLQPLVMYSTSSEILLVKLLAIKKILAKSRDLICSKETSLEERSEIIGIPLFMIKKNLEETDKSIRELRGLENNIHHYFQIKKEGSFWQKIRLGRKPSYTLDDLAKRKLMIKKEIFVSIVRLAKSENHGMIYLEFECDEIINENYRHYALADGELGISRLPRVLRLPEDKVKFDTESIRDAVNHNIFESSQPWKTQV